MTLKDELQSPKTNLPFNVAHLIVIGQHAITKVCIAYVVQLTFNFLTRRCLLLTLSNHAIQCTKV